jgi:hypothetical protein
MYKTKSSKLKFVMIFIFSSFLSGINAQFQGKYLSTVEVEDFMKKNEKNHQDKNNGLGLAYEISLKETPEFIVDEFKSMEQVMDVFIRENTLKIFIKKTDENYLDERLNDVLKANKLENLKINKYIFIY